MQQQQNIKHFWHLFDTVHVKQEHFYRRKNESESKRSKKKQVFEK